MSSEKNENGQPAVSQTQSAAGTNPVPTAPNTTPNTTMDEIDQIMNEIEQLQQSMLASQQPAAVPPEVPTPTLPTAAAPSPASAPESVPVSESPSAEGWAPVAPDASMQEFQASPGDTSMEEALADLKDDEPARPSLLDSEAPTADSSSGDFGVADAVATSQSHPQSQSPVLATALSPLPESSEASSETHSEVISMHDSVVRNSKSPASSPVSSSSTSGDAVVDIRLQGQMALRLSYEFESQEVMIRFESGSLCVELSDGTEFKIPVQARRFRQAA